MIIYNFEQLKQFKNLAGIYVFTDKTDESKHYIGKSVDLYSRIFYCHKNAKNYRTQYISRIIKRYGLLERFRLEIIHWWDSKVDNQEILALETAAIDDYKSLVKDGGYNVCLFGSDSIGSKRTEQQKFNISKSKVGTKNPCFGRKHTKESIENLKIKCKIQNIENKISPVKQIDKASNSIIKTWESMKDAAIELNINVSGISAVCRKYKDKDGYIHQSYKGFLWEYA